MLCAFTQQCAWPFRQKCVVLQLPLSGICAALTSSTLLILCRSFTKPFREFTRPGFLSSRVTSVVIFVVVLHSLVPQSGQCPTPSVSLSPPYPPTPFSASSASSSVLLPASRSPSFYSPVALVNMINSTPLFFPLRPSSR